MIVVLHYTYLYVYVTFLISLVFVPVKFSHAAEMCAGIDIVFIIISAREDGKFIWGLSPVARRMIKYIYRRRVYICILVFAKCIIDGLYTDERRRNPRMIHIKKRRVKIIMAALARF